MKGNVPKHAVSQVDSEVRRHTNEGEGDMGRVYKGTLEHRAHPITPKTKFMNIFQVL